MPAYCLRSPFERTAAAFVSGKTKAGFPAYHREVNVLSVLQEYKCPCCGGSVEFDSSVQKMKCPYCDSEFSIEDLKKAADESGGAKDTGEMDWESSVGQEWKEGETDSMRVYSCKSCGGEIIADETTGATHCPYCGNPVIMTGQFSGALRPDYIIPFKLDKKAAKAALLKHVHSKRFVPKIFKDSNHIDEIKGVYVPFWLFDADSFGDVDFAATKTRQWSDSTYNYTETSYFKVKRSGKVSFLNVPVDGSKRWMTPSWNPLSRSTSMKPLISKPHISPAILPTNMTLTTSRAFKEQTPALKKAPSRRLKKPLRDTPPFPFPQAPSGFQTERSDMRFFPFGF